MPDFLFADLEGSTQLWEQYRSMSFLGREAELAEIAQRLREPSCRSLTLSGPDGIGKTRLALELATRQNQQFRHGSFFLHLAPSSSFELLSSTVAELLGLSFYSGEDAKQCFIRYVSDKELLLVLDNIDCLLDGPKIVAEILARAPGIKVVGTTNQERPIQPNASLIQIKGLSVPPENGADDAEDYGAVQLFYTVVGRTVPAFTPSKVHRSKIVHLCRLVQGIPLTIEVMAALLGIASPEEAIQTVTQQLQLNDGSLPHLSPAQRSLRAAFECSWSLLSVEEQNVLEKLVVFRGGFRREAAPRVAGASLSLLSSLVQKALLHQSASGRYEMHEALREYLNEKLNQRPEEQVKAQDLRCGYYADFVDYRVAHLVGQRQKEALAEIREEFGNVRAGLRWAVELDRTPELRKYLRGLYLFYVLRGWSHEAEDILVKTAVRAGDRGVAIAHEAVRDALQIATNRYDERLMLRILLNKAALLAHTREAEPAVELLALVQAHPAGDADLKRYVEQLLPQIEPRLSPDAVSVAQARGKARDLMAVVGTFLDAKQ